MRIAVFGAGYVGIVTAAGFAKLGMSATLFDTNVAKIATLRAGGVPLYEPDLRELVAGSVTSGLLAFADDAATTVRDCAIAMIAVGTPTGADGRADCSNVYDAAQAIAAYSPATTLIVNKSTAPAGTAEALSRLTGRAVAANPEFLREGRAVRDFFTPDRIVIGRDDAASERALRELYAPIDAPLIVTTTRSAELIKYASNAFLAMKVSFANEIAAICDASNADTNVVLAGAGADSRIGSTYLDAGLGFGGSCLPKDVRELQRIAADGDIEPALLSAVLAVNDRQFARIAGRIEAILGGLRAAHIGVLGLSFKPETDDVREAPAIALIRALSARGATVCVHDPVAMDNARHVLGESVTYAPLDDLHHVAHGADALVIATEWSVYGQLDFTRLRGMMKRPLLIDTRNLYAPQDVIAAGFGYEGIGRRS
jgi:UDPglucose 6-dehydrogenase